MSEILAAYAQRLKEHPPERPTCKTCPYWAAFGLHDDDDDDFIDECRRRPPVSAEDDSDGSAQQGDAPYVSPDYFCGEHPDFSDYLRELKDAKAYV